MRTSLKTMLQQRVRGAGQHVWHNTYGRSNQTMKWSDVGRLSLTGRLARNVARRAGTFAPDAFPKNDLRFADALDRYYENRMPSTSVSVGIDHVNWRGYIAIRDSHKHRDDVPVVTCIFTHGLMCNGTMFADVIKPLQSRFADQPVRFVTVDLPGHGGSSKPDPGDFHYRMDTVAPVVDAAVSEFTQPSERLIHVTQSLGYLWSMHDVNMANFRIRHHIAVGTSSEQAGLFAFQPLANTILGGASLMDMAIGYAPDWLINYPDFFRVFALWVGNGSPRDVFEHFLRQTHSGKATKAWMDYMHDLPGYVRNGRRMATGPVPPYPISVDLIGSRGDQATPLRDVRKHAAALSGRTNFIARMHEEPGNHFSMGDNAVRRRLQDTIAQAIDGQLASSQVRTGGEQ